MFNDSNFLINFIILLSIIVFIIGLCLGSFYLLTATRLLKNEDILFKPSHCEFCNKKLKWYNLIPVLSYIFQGAKCSYCKKRLSIIYPIIEIFMGLSLVYIYLSYGLTYDFYISFILISLFIIICITDFREYIILNSPLIIGAVLIIIFQFIYLDYIDVIHNIVTGIILFLIMWGIKKLGDVLFKKESLGGGDIKFSFIIGLTVGFQLSMFVLIISAFLALPTSIATILTTKNKELPYGPFLAGALVLVFLNYDKFINLIYYIIA